MENQEFNPELMDYLYGEMTADERRIFEHKLESDTELKKELDDLNLVRNSLDELTDKEVMEPFSTWGKTKSTGLLGAFSKRNLIVFRPVTAVAASLLILMLVGYITNFSVSMTDNGFHLGYGKSDLKSEKSLSEDDIKKLLRQEVAQNNEMLLAKLGSEERDLQNKFSVLEASVASDLKANSTNILTKEDLDNYFSQVENRNTGLMKDYLKLTSNQQQEYLKTMLTQFNEFMQEQRKQDLAMVRNNLIELKQSQSEQKQETDQVLASILSTVNKN